MVWGWQLNTCLHVDEKAFEASAMSMQRAGEQAPQQDRASNLEPATWVSDGEALRARLGAACEAVAPGFEATRLADTIDAAEPWVPSPTSSLLLSSLELSDTKVYAPSVRAPGACSN